MSDAEFREEVLARLGEIGVKVDALVDAYLAQADESFNVELAERESPANKA